MSLKERLTKFATTPGGVIPASPGFMPDDARKVLALIAAARESNERLKKFFNDEYRDKTGCDETVALDAALDAMEK